MVLLLTACGGEEQLHAHDLPSRSRQEIRPDALGNQLVPGYTADDVVDVYAEPDASVLVHFSRSGPSAVPTLDADDSGVPDFVEHVARVYGEVTAAYHDEWGFRVPPSDVDVPGGNGGDGRFDAYLLDFALRADGAFVRECLSAEATACPGYMTQENDFVGYGYPSAAIGSRIVSSHEYFHAVQAGYAVGQGVVLTEAAAVWATERFDPSLNDFEHFVPGYLATPERPLDQEPTGPVDSYAYGAALFIECLTARHGDDTVLRLYESLDGGEKWLPALHRVLSEDGGEGVRPVLQQCFEYNLFTGSRARTGYGHRRAGQLAQVPVTEEQGGLVVSRSPMFRSSSRYWRVGSLPEGAVAWWAPLPGGPVDGSSYISVRLVEDVPGTAPSFSNIPSDEDTPVGSGDFLVVVTHTEIQVATVPISLCVGTPEEIASCRAALVPDAGTTTDAGVTPEPEPENPQPCGCSSGPLSALALLCFLALRRPVGRDHL